MGTDVLVHNEEEKKTYKWDIVWPNVIALLVLHLIALYALIYERGNCTWQSVIFWKVVALLSSLGITGGAHRLWAHRSYKANKAVELLLICLMSMTYHKSVYNWCRDHRVHHKYSETDADPHNAKRGFFFSHMGWLCVKKHKDVIEAGKTVDFSDLESNSLVMFQHKYYYFFELFFAVSLTTFIPWYYWGETLMCSFCLGTIYRYIVTVHCTWCINSIAHLYGNKPYNKNIGPSENAIAISLIIGEGFHNYHHTFPYDYKAAEFGNDSRNLTTMMIDMFAWFGWVTDRQFASKELIEKIATKTGDGSHTEKIPYNFHDCEPRTTYKNIRDSLIFIAFAIYF